MVDAVSTLLLWLLLGLMFAAGYAVGRSRTREPVILRLDPRELDAIVERVAAEIVLDAEDEDEDDVEAEFWKQHGDGWKQ